MLDDRSAQAAPADTAGSLQAILASDTSGSHIDAVGGGGPRAVGIRNSCNAVRAPAAGKTAVLQ